MYGVGYVSGGSDGCIALDRCMGVRGGGGVLWMGCVLWMGRSNGCVEQDGGMGLGCVYGIG